MDNSFGIGELARQTACTIETIRYYERIGVIPRAARTSGRYRTYDGDDVRRLRFVRRARELGFGLDEVRLLLGFTTEAAERCAEVREVAAKHLEAVRAKIADLSRIESFLDGFIGECRPGSRDRCRILEVLLSDQPSGIASDDNQAGAPGTGCCDD
jgi:MerR family mercuric resistance operon transcriptional regulator